MRSKSLQPGQISEVVETEYGFHIIQARREERRPVPVPAYSAAAGLYARRTGGGGRFLDSLANEIRGGAITFEDAAMKYSDDKYSRQNGGIVTNHELLELMHVSDTRYSTTKFLREDLRTDYPAISALKEGEISPAFQSRDLRNNEP